MNDKQIQAILDEYKDVTQEHKPLIYIGRKPLQLSKIPKDLDFSKNIGNTTYSVRSHFNPEGRWLVRGKF